VENGARLSRIALGGSAMAPVSPTKGPSMNRQGLSPGPPAGGQYEKTAGEEGFEAGALAYAKASSGSRMPSTFSGGGRGRCGLIRRADKPGSTTLQYAPSATRAVCWVRHQRHQWARRTQSLPSRSTSGPGSARNPARLVRQWQAGKIGDRPPSHAALTPWRCRNIGVHPRSEKKSENRGTRRRLA